LFATIAMKSPRHTQLLAFALASLFAFPASPAFAADANPRVIEQKQRIDQLQRRLTDEQSGQALSPIIRTKVKVRFLSAKEDKTIFDSTLITQSLQESRLRVGEISVSLTSSVDQQSNITTALDVSTGSSGPIKLPSAKSRPGQLITINEGPVIVDIVADILEPKGISVDFPGGTLAQLLTAISNSGSQPFNLIASKEALALPLPQFSLRNVGPRDLALALDQLLVGYIVDFPTEKTERDGLPVFTLRATEPVHQQNAETKQRPSRATSYPITQLLQAQMPIDKVIDSINAAWTLDPANKPDDLKVKYHEGTGILLVSSRDERALALVDRMIMSLREQAEYLKYKAAQTQSPSVEQPKR
jgi:hypothetical protein